MKITHQGRAGYIECEQFRFHIEMMACGPTYAIYFPRRKHDKKLARIRKSLEEHVSGDPKNWEISDFDGPHGFYGAMTVNERLCVAEAMSDFEAAIVSGDYRLAGEILADLDLDPENVRAIVDEEKRRRG